MKHPFKQQHFLSVDSLTPDTISLLFQETDNMKQLVLNEGRSSLLSSKVVAAIFYEPSTRTFISFMSAAQRLGAGILPFLGMSTSSVAKGETIQDTIRTVSCSADVIIMRHPEVGSVELAAQYSYVPVINGGDGNNEHPTQALLDVYTIANHFPNYNSIQFGWSGDLLNGRTLHSNVKLLANLGVRNFTFISPKELKMPKKIIEYVESRGGKIQETENLNEVIGDLDVLYTTRVQKERFTDLTKYEKLKHKYIITPEVMQQAKKKMILMHPLPRVGEITDEVDTDPRAVYIKEQMQNGVYVRMALLKLILAT
jgi:aspartate carbamoyltransferase